MAIVLSRYYAVDWCVWGLEVIIPCIVIIEGGLGHSPTGVAGPGMGWNVNCRGQFGHGVGIGGCSYSAVAP